MNLKNIPNGAYDVDLNKTNFDFCRVDSSTNKLKYIIHDNQRFELKKEPSRGSIICSEVTNAGVRGTGVRLKFHDINSKDSLKVCDGMNLEFDSITSFVNYFNASASTATDGAIKFVEVGGVSMNVTLTYFGTGRTFSILGTYPPLKKRPRKWSNWLVVRGLANFQLQQVESDTLNVYGDNLKSRDTLSKNVYLANDLANYPDARSRWEGDNDQNNTIRVSIDQNYFYILEIIDPNLQL